MSEEVLTPEEVAQELKMAPKTIMDWLRSGKLPGRKYGRFWRILRSDFEEFKRGGKRSKRGGKPAGQERKG